MRIFFSSSLIFTAEAVHHARRDQTGQKSLSLSDHIFSALTPTMKKNELLWKTTNKAGICSISLVQTLLASNNFQLGKFPKPPVICLLSNHQLISLPNAC